MVLIAGGRSKGLDLSPLAQHTHLRRLVAIGEAAPALLDAAPARGRRSGPATWPRRFGSPTRPPPPASVVLLAPGGASFDMFDSYAHRGDVFADEVRSRHSGEEGSRQPGGAG